MKKYILLSSIIALQLLIMSCGHTRVEEDTFTITKRDTTYQSFVNNAPGNRDEGQVLPSSRTFNNFRDILQYDSTVVREYPDFIRLGLFESIGLIGSSSENKIGAGLFGLYPDFDNLNHAFDEDFEGIEDALFSGGIYRIGIYEDRLRWFKDSPDWTWGFNGIEFLAPNALTKNTLMTVAPFYLNKRFYLREEIPYVAVTLSAGIGWFPMVFSNYLNLSASLDIGSLGGVNFRTYLGFVAGYNGENTWQIRGAPDKQPTSVAFPYLGIGVSVLDFHNLVEEKEIQWKHHEHSSWSIGLVQFGALTTTADKAMFTSDSDSTDKLIKGMSLRVANTAIAIPLWNNKFYAGTSLLNLLLLGKDEWGIGVLPIRIGYWTTLIADELSLEPFIEYNYFPSSFFNLGANLNLAANENFNISLLLGYASGTTDFEFTSGPFEDFGYSTDFSRPYVGLSVNIGSRIFFPEQLRYNK